MPLPTVRTESLAQQWYCCDSCVAGRHDRCVRVLLFVVRVVTSLGAVCVRLCAVDDGCTTHDAAMQG